MGDWYYIYIQRERESEREELLELYRAASPLVGYCYTTKYKCMIIAHCDFESY
jgi:hypothetical protein